MTCGDPQTLAGRGTSLTAPVRVTRLRSGRPPLQDGRRGRGGQTPHRRPSVGTDRARTLSRQRGWPRSRRGRPPDRRSVRARSSPRPGRPPRSTRRGVRRCCAATGTAARPRAPLALAAGGVALDLAFPGPAGGSSPLVGVAVLTLAVRGRRARARPAARAGRRLAFFVPLLPWSGIYVGALPGSRSRSRRPASSPCSAPRCAGRGARPAARSGPCSPSPASGCCRRRCAARLPFGGFPWGRLAFSPGRRAVRRLGRARRRPAGHRRRRGRRRAASPSPSADARPASRLGTARRAPGSLARPAAVVVAASSPAAARLALRGRRCRPAARRPPVAGVQGNVPGRARLQRPAPRGARQPRARDPASWPTPSRAGARRSRTSCVWPENATDIDPLRNADADGRDRRAVDAVGVPDPGRRRPRRAGRPRLATPASSGPGHRARARPLRQAAPGAVRRVHPATGRSSGIFSDEVDLVAGTSPPGTGAGVLADRRRPAIGDVICFEVAYDDMVRDVRRPAAPTSSSSRPTTPPSATPPRRPSSWRCQPAARRRARPRGRPRRRPVGISALIAPDGRVDR